MNSITATQNCTDSLALFKYDVNRLMGPLMGFFEHCDETLGSVKEFVFLTC